jgi:aminoglycoside phosphotransferase (APT) family kinase protein
MLEEIVAIGVGAPTSAPSADVVHFDFSFANVLTDGERITGVIDWNVPWPGDRAFDVATLLFYAYERPDLRSWLWEQLLGRTSPEWAVVYLAHMVLRQVEWSVRHYPGSTVEQHYLAVGRAVLNDLSIL